MSDPSGRKPELPIDMTTLFNSRYAPSYDPAGGSNLVTKMGIDAIRKSNYPDEVSVLGVGSINLAEYIPGYEGR
jgi:hypothetical protein